MKFVMNSGDVKLTDRKNVAVTWNETGTSCPSSCMFHPEPDAVGEAKREAFGRVTVCYTKKGRSNLQQAKAGTVDALKLRVSVKRFLDLRKLEKGEGVTAAKRVDAVRWHVSGDVFSNDAPDIAYIQAQVWACEQMEAEGVKTIGYTHGWRYDEVQPLKKWFMASCDTAEEVRDARAKGWMTTVVVDVKNIHTREDLGDAKLTICPNQITDGRVKCVDCMLCSPSSLPSLETPRVIGFRYH
jgi:hypothetical protein